MARINLYAGPGSGKTTVCARLFADLKQRQVSVEQVTEYVKAWAYQRREIHPLDQIYLHGKQMEYEHRFLRAGVKNIITDSPCFQSVIYAHLYAPELVPGLVLLTKEYDKKYPPVNLFIERGDKPYVTEGRYQSYEQAKELDKIIFDKLVEYEQDPIAVPFSDYNTILNIVMSRIDG